MKKTLRKELLQKRLSLTEQYVEDASEIIYKKIVESPEYITANTIMCYMDFRNEVKTRKINDKILKDGKTLILPLTDMKEKKLFLYKVTDLEKDLVRSKYGILEPKRDNEETKLESIDLILVPGVAFNSDNFRMGYGGGFYDRLLANYTGNCIGLFFEEQKSDKLIIEPHDQGLITIITEENIYKLKKL